MSCSGLKSLVLLCLALQAATSVDGGISSIPNHAPIKPTATRKVAAKSVCPKPSTTTRTITNTATSFVTIKPTPATTTVTSRTTTTIRPTPATTTFTSRTTTTITPPPSTTTVTSRTTTTIIPTPSTTTFTSTIKPPPSTTTLTSTITPTPVTTTVTTTIQPSCSVTPDPMSSTEPSTPSESSTPESNPETSTDSGPESSTTPSTPSESTTLESSTETSTTGPIVPIGCESVAQVVGTWDGGLAVDFNVPFNTDMNDWTFDVQLSGSFSCLSMNASVFRGLSNFVVSGTSFQSAGSVVTIPANVGYGTGKVLTITAMSLNGQKVCGSSSARRENHQIVNFSRIRPIEEAYRYVNPCDGCCCAFDNQCNCKNLQDPPMTCNKLVDNFVVIQDDGVFHLTLPFSEGAPDWIATVTFSTPISSLSTLENYHYIWQKGPTEFQISHSFDDGVQCSGSAVILSLEALGVTSETAIIGVTVNGRIGCIGGDHQQIPPP